MYSWSGPESRVFSRRTSCSSREKPPVSAEERNPVSPLSSAAVSFWQNSGRRSGNGSYNTRPEELQPGFNTVRRSSQDAP